MRGLVVRVLAVTFVLYKNNLKMYTNVAAKSRYNGLCKIT